MRNRLQTPSRRLATLEQLENRHLLAVLTVTSLRDGGLAELAGDGLLSLREAVTAVQQGAAVDGMQPSSGEFGVDDRIQFAASLFDESRTLELTSGQLGTGKAVSIEGPGRDLLTIDAQHKSRIFQSGIWPFRMAGVTLARGWSEDDGGAILSQGHLTLDGVTIRNSRSADSGGAVRFDEGVVKNSTITENTSGEEGGGIYGDAMEIENSVLSRNTTSGEDGLGGGIYAQDALNLLNSIVRDNVTQGEYGQGGGIYLDYESNGFIRGSQISGNRTEAAWVEGGGIFTYGKLVIENSRIVDNSAAGSGGGVAVRAEDGPTTLTVADSEIAGNSALDSGGGIFAAAEVPLTVTVVRSEFAGNSSAWWGGGGIAVLGESSFLRVSESTFRDNSARAGGSIYGWKVELTQTTLAHNSAHNSGGGAVAKDLTLINSTVHGNRAVWSGGGLSHGGFEDFSNGSMTLLNSTVSDNLASRGGGISAQDLNLVNSTVVNNTASELGGGIHTGYQDKTIRLANSVVAGNSAGTDGSDIYQWPNRMSGERGTLVLEHSLLGDNAGTDVKAGSWLDASRNLIGTNETGVIDPQLGPLADNGGSTLTHRPYASSPVIDAGHADLALNPDSSPLLLDQRGQARVQRIIDMGAVETDLALLPDFGDAPAPYPTLLADNGARHALIANRLWLGRGVDSDVDGMPDNAAEGDDRVGFSDESGVVFQPLNPGETTPLQVTVSGEGFLQGWIDLNADGDWTDAEEQFLVDRPVVAGTNSVSVSIPSDTRPVSATYARFRLSSEKGLPFEGLAPDGEVEDYALSIGKAANWSLASELVSIDAASGVMIYALTAQNNGRDAFEARLNTRPKGIESIAWTCTATENSDCGHAGEFVRILAEAVTLNPGGTAKFRVAALPSRGAHTPSLGFAAKSLPLRLADPHLEDNVTAAVGLDDDLALELTQTITDAVAGAHVEFGIGVRHDSEIPIQNLALLFEIEGVRDLSWSCSASAGSSCSAHSTRMDLGPNGTVNYRFHGIATGDVAVEAALSASPWLLRDRDEANNSVQTSRRARSLAIDPAADSIIASTQEFVITRLLDDLDPSSLASASVALARSQSASSAVNTVRDSGNQIVLRPTAPLSAGESVTVSVSGLTTAGGEPIRPTVWQFRVGATPSSGRFRSTDQVFAGDELQSVDVDGDGDLDVLAKELWLNHGDGTFERTDRLDGILPAEALAAADFNRDGAVDLVVTRRGHIEVWLNDVAGQFSLHHQQPTSRPRGSISLIEVDGDGDLDVITFHAADSRANLWSNNGDGTLLRAVSHGLDSIRATTLRPTILDVDRDGDLDLAAQSAQGGSGTILHNPHADARWRAYSSRLNSPKDLAQGDVNGDSYPDLLWASTSRNAQRQPLWLSDDTGNFAASTQTFARARGVALADVDGDLDLDAILSEEDGARIWLNDGAGNFARTPEILPTDGWGKVHTGDFDQDNDIDVIVNGRLFLNVNELVEGDVNLDGRVEFDDYLILAANFGKQDASRTQGDLNDDGKVAFDDFLLLAKNFGRQQ